MPTLNKHPSLPPPGTSPPPDDGVLESMDFARIRFAGDSGDGMQITGMQFAASTALSGNDLATFPDFPAEIRAPAGATFGVSSYSINFGSTEILTAGDMPDVLIAMNPAALKVHAPEVRRGGIIVVDEDTFISSNLEKAGFIENPLDDGSLDAYNLMRLSISKFTLDAVSELKLSHKDSLRCKNMWALGLILWMFDRKREPVVEWLRTKFANNPQIANANIAALSAGDAFGETAEMGSSLRRYTIAKTEPTPGKYRTITGAEAATWGLYAASCLADMRLMLGSYPITPASPLLHSLSKFKEQGVITFQAEDEIAAICSVIGASFAGALGVTVSSGPGMALKTEALGLCTSVELPLVIVNVQRGGPSTGLPTKTEQADLNQAVFGRNGDTPIPVIAASSPSDCFDCAIEAVRIAIRYMTPIILLLDGYIANAAEPWLIPDFDSYEPIPVKFREKAEGFHPFLRDPETMARNWAIPGTKGLEHCIGGLEKDFDSGNISYDGANHQSMTDARVGKIAKIADWLPPQTVSCGDTEGELAIVGWGSSYGPIQLAVRRARLSGLSVAHIHLRHIWPLPKNLGELLGNYDKVIVAEMNKGQLINILRAQYLIDMQGLNKVTGQPFRVAEITSTILDAFNANQV